MNEEYLIKLRLIIDKANELYNLFEELYKLDNQKSTTRQIDVLSKIKAKQDEYEALLSPISEDKNFINTTIEFIKQMNKMVTLDDPFLVFQNRKTLVLRRVYTDLVNLSKTDSKAFENLLTGYFKKAACENMSNNTYLVLALFYYGLEVDYRIIELLKDKKEFSKVKYTLAFLNPTVHYTISQENYEDVPHSFNGNTILETEFYISDEKKEEFKNAYGYFMFTKAYKLLKTANDSFKEYLKILIRVANLFMSENTINNILESIKIDPFFELVKELVNCRSKDFKQANQFATKLNKETMSTINKIFEVSETIRNIYSSLISLEESGQKDSKHYQSMLNYLITSLKEEQEYYEYFKICPEETAKATEFVFEILDKKNYRELTTEVALDDIEDELIIVRIIKRLHQLALDDDEYFVDIADDDDIKICDSDLDFRLVRNSMQHYDEEYNYQVLRLLDIDSDSRLSLKFKYNLSFLDAKIEREMLKGNIDGLPGTFSKNVPSRINGVSQEKVSLINNKYALKRLLLIIDDIIEFTDQDILDSDVSADYDYHSDEENEEIHNEKDTVIEAESLDEEQSEEELAQMEEDDEEYFQLTFQLLLAEFKVCILFTDNTGLSEIRKKVDERYKYMSTGHNIIFNEIYDILSKAEELRRDSNKDLSSYTL